MDRLALAPSVEITAPGTAFSKWLTHPLFFDHEIATCLPSHWAVFNFQSPTHNGAVLIAATQPATKSSTDGSVSHGFGISACPWGLSASSAPATSAACRAFICAICHWVYPKYPAEPSARTTTGIASLRANPDRLKWIGAIRHSGLYLFAAFLSLGRNSSKRFSVESGNPHWIGAMTDPQSPTEYMPARCEWIASSLPMRSPSGRMTPSRWTTHNHKSSRPGTGTATSALAAPVTLSINDATHAATEYIPFAAPSFDKAIPA